MRVRLVAVRGGEVDDGARPAQRLAVGARIGQVADRDLDPDALGPQAARIADQAAHRLAARGEAPQQGGADESGGTGEQQHDGL